MYSVSRCLEAKLQTPSSDTQEMADAETQLQREEMEEEADLCWRVLEISVAKARRREPTLLRRVLVRNTLWAVRAAACAASSVPPSTVLRPPPLR